MPDERRGWSGEREREYEKLKGEFEKEDRYEGREEEVAARIVNKQRSQQSETKEERAEDREQESPDRGLPISNYDHLTVDEISNRLDNLSDQQVREIKSYEQKHRDRKSLLTQIDRKLK